jgi:mevalonate kinase
MKSFYSNGKLLITGEYVVLDGAESLALPTKYGQKLSVQKTKELKLIWESYTYNHDSLKEEIWLQVEFDLPKLRIISATFGSKHDGGDDFLAEKLQEILRTAQKYNPHFLIKEQGFILKSRLDFPKYWGLGSSSTLINNIAQWANIDAFDLQYNTFGGSGYDIACAQNNKPILYQLNHKKPSFKNVNFNPVFKDQLYFIYLNKKQNSRESIASYKNFKKDAAPIINAISRLTHQINDCISLTDFEKYLIEHENLISKLIHQEPIQKLLFSDYFGQTKSLGAWGGDFILATGNLDTTDYFKKKGFETVIPYSQMIL